MCLSPEVDLAAGIGISVFAVDSLRHLHHGRAAPLALLPAVFAVHSFTSVVVWWGAQGKVPASVGDTAADFFMLVAFALLPVYVPISILLLEPRGWRRDALILLVGAGAVAGATFYLGLSTGQGQAVACDYYIDYLVIGTPTYAGVLYVIATCGAMLLSSQHALVYWGVANMAAVAVLAMWARAGLPSLWCFWAACTSVFIAWLMRRLDHQTRAGLPPPWKRAGSPARRVPQHTG